MTSHLWQRVNTGESYIFYFGIFICCATLKFPVNSHGSVFHGFRELSLDSVVFSNQRYLAFS